MSDLIDRQELLRIIDQRILNKKDARKQKHSALFVEGMEDGYLRIRSDVCQMPSAQPERNPGKTLAEEVERIKREITDIFAEQMGVQPSAQSKRMRGRWVKDEEASSQHCESIYVCSACNNMDAWGEAEKNTFKFCPNCGADMRG